MNFVRPFKYAFEISYIKEMLSSGQFRMDAVKKYLSDAVLAQIEQSDRAEWLKTVKAAVDLPVPVAPPRGILGRLL